MSCDLQFPSHSRLALEAAASQLGFLSCFSLTDSAVAATDASPTASLLSVPVSNSAVPLFDPAFATVSKGAHTCDTHTPNGICYLHITCVSGRVPFSVYYFHLSLLSCFRPPPHRHWHQRQQRRQRRHHWRRRHVARCRSRRRHTVRRVAAPRVTVGACIADAREDQTGVCL